MIAGWLGRLFRAEARLLGREAHRSLEAVGEELERLERRRRQRPVPTTSR